MDMELNIGTSPLATTFGTVYGSNMDIQNVVFVDGDNGLAGNTGLEPTAAMNSLTNAVSKVVRNGVIYIRPKQTVASAQSYYTDNVVIPLTKPGLKILGCGSNEDNPYGGGPEIKGSATTSAVITVRAQGITIEGLRLAGTGLDATVSTVSAVDNTSTYITTGLTIRNCRFGNGRGHSAEAAAVFLNSSWFNTIEKCVFNDCLTGVSAFTNSGGITNNLRIIDCEFSGVTTNRTVDIYVSGGSTSNGLTIKGCLFNDGLPAHADGTVSRFIYIVNAITGSISQCWFAVDVDAAAGTEKTFGASGTGAVIPTTVLITDCHGEIDTEGDSDCIART